jgi:hypothetical protein
MMMSRAHSNLPSAPAKIQDLFLNRMLDSLDAKIFGNFQIQGHLQCPRIDPAKGRTEFENSLLVQLGQTSSQSPISMNHRSSGKVLA